MLTGRRVAFDVGRARIGVAISDFHSILASPAAKIDRGADLDGAVAKAAAVIAENEAVCVYVGYAVNLKNQSTESTHDSVAFAKLLADSVDVEVRLIDERMTTTSAAAALRSAGVSTRDQKSVIDSAAATIILEQALRIEKTTSALAGTIAKEIEVEE